MQLRYQATTYFFYSFKPTTSRQSAGTINIQMGKLKTITSGHIKWRQSYMCEEYFQKAIQHK